MWTRRVAALDQERGVLRGKPQLTNWFGRKKILRKDENPSVTKSKGKGKGKAIVDDDEDIAEAVKLIEEFFQKKMENLVEVINENLQKDKEEVTSIVLGCLLRKKRKPTADAGLGEVRGNQATGVRQTGTFVADQAARVSINPVNIEESSARSQNVAASAGTELLNEPIIEQAGLSHITLEDHATMRRAAPATTEEPSSKRQKVAASIGTERIDERMIGTTDEQQGTCDMHEVPLVQTGPSGMNCAEKMIIGSDTVAKN